MKNPNYYAIIPAKVRYCSDLSASEKLLYGEITALCGKDRVCWATNKYFANLYNVSERSITVWIADLVRLGFIISDVKKDKGNVRYIKIKTEESAEKTTEENCGCSEENCGCSEENCGSPMEHSCGSPMEEKFGQNNINNNNKNNNNIFLSKTEIFDEIIKYWNIVAERWNLAKIRVMTDKRLKDFKLRYKESGCKSVKEFFQLIDEAIMGSLFLQGKKQVKDHNGEWDIITTDWISYFDFFLQAKSCMKALEGGYDDPDVRKQKSCGQWERFKQMYEERKPVHFD